MSRIRPAVRLATYLSLACVFTAIATPSPAEAGNAIVKNGGFEDGLFQWEAFNARLDGAVWVDFESE